MKPLVVVGALCAACLPDPPQPQSGDCQIQSEQEQAPGFPYDLQLFEQRVLPVLVATCALGGCHAAPAGNAGFTVWADAAPGNCSYARTFNAVARQVDLVTPENSNLLLTVDGTSSTHPMVLPAGDTRLATLVEYVEDAARRLADLGGGGTTPPPGASPFDYPTFQTVIQPMLDAAEGRGCTAAACHGGGAGGFRLEARPAADGAAMEANFLAVTQRTNLDDPTRSQVYLRATTRHAAGASALLAGADAARLLGWIEEAQRAADDGAPATCPSIDLFNVGVFRDDVQPILFGDVDLNDPGALVETVGCARTACHGQDRGGGALVLKESWTAEQNLRNLVCFFDLVSPPTSQALLCPSGSPSCVAAPHPGGRVLGGPGDRNYQRLLSYVYAARNARTPLDFAFFARRVNPIFDDLRAVQAGAQGRSCADTVACHGVAAAGAPPPNGSNFPILANAAGPDELAVNFASALSFANFLAPEGSSLFLYPTNEIADLANAFATGLPHPGGADFAPDSVQARAILRWAGGLRPDGDGFLRDWLVAGDYPATSLADPTAVDEASASPRIFDRSGATAFNAGEWDALFADAPTVDLGAAFPRAGTSGRVVYAVAYLRNVTSLPILAEVTLTTANAARLIVDGAAILQVDRGSGSTLVTLPAGGGAAASTRLVVKALERRGDGGLSFSLSLRDQLGATLDDRSGEIVVQLGPEGGI